ASVHEPTDRHVREPERALGDHARVEARNQDAIAPVGGDQGARGAHHVPLRGDVSLELDVEPGPRVPLPVEPLGERWDALSPGELESGDLARGESIEGDLRRGRVWKAGLSRSVALAKRAGLLGSAHPWESALLLGSTRPLGSTGGDPLGIVDDDELA